MSGFYDHGHPKDPWNTFWCALVIVGIVVYTFVTTS
jgi:hypothetical protein